MSSLDNDKTENFIQERLDSLHEIDCKVVTLLDQFSSIFQSFYTKSKEDFSQQTSDIYSTLSKVAIDLRKEIKIMDDNIGAYDKNDDNVMILPISNVDQKNTKLGRKRLNLELAELKRLISDEKQVETLENESNNEIQLKTESDTNQVETNENGNDTNNKESEDIEMKE